MPLEGALEQIGPVVRYKYKLLFYAARNARRRGKRRRLRFIAQLIRRRAQAEHDLVVIAVKVAFELQQLWPSGEGAGQPDEVHRGLGPRTGEPDPLAARDGLAKQFRQLRMQLVFIRTGGPPSEYRFDGLANSAVAVAQQRGPVTAAKIDVLAVIEIPQAASCGAAEQHRMAEGSVPTRRGRYAARQLLPGMLIL